MYQYIESRKNSKQWQPYNLPQYTFHVISRGYVLSTEVIIFEKICH